MKTKMLLRSIVLSCLATVHMFHVSSAITSSDDRFVKKYAMMKVYESCYGPEVLKEVRKEMKAASNKCSNFIMSSASSPPSYATASSNSFKIASPFTSHHPYHSKPSSASNSGGGSTSPGMLHDETKTTPSNTIDVAKLQQVILAGYKNVGNQHNQQQSNQQQQQQFQQTPYSSYQQNPIQSAAAAAVAANSLSPASSQVATSNILQQAAAMAALSQLPQTSQAQLRPYLNSYSPASVSSAFNSMFFPNNLFAQSMNPFFSAAAGQINPYTAALYTSLGLNPFYPGRAARDMDVRGQLETLTARMSGKVKNVTCVMQELGYLDNNLEPDYTRMVERINRLPVSDELKKDMSDGVEYCRQFSTCVPDERKDKLAKEMIRPMFFFRCYKHKKLESCIMKDIRERYSTDDLTDDTFSNSINAEMRSLKRKKSRRNNKNKKFAEEDDGFASSIYDFMYGGEEIELDALL